MKGLNAVLNKHLVPIAAAVARLAPLSDGKMGATKERSARIIAVMAALAVWKLN